MVFQLHQILLIEISKPVMLLRFQKAKTDVTMRNNHQHMQELSVWENAGVCMYMHTTVYIARYQILKRRWIKRHLKG